MTISTNIKTDDRDPDVNCRFSTILTHLIDAQRTHEMGMSQETAEYVEQALRCSYIIHARHFAFHALISQIRFAFDKGYEEAGNLLLRKALSTGKEIGLYDYDGINLYGPITRPCNSIPERGANEKVDLFCNRERNPSATAQPENRSWPFKIFTLGRFSIVKGGAPITFATKAQKKPLEMIKALIALGGRDVSKTEISDDLWPDADGDKADQTFATTLHRLRRLLGNEQAVQIQDGKLNLNPYLCWVDCWFFERMLSQADRASERRDDDTANKLTQKAIRVYRGAFLASDDSMPWTVSRRERLRSKFLLAINRIGADLASAGQWEKAAAWYSRSLDVDDLSEQSYQSLMRCLLQLGQKSECVSVYNRCTKNLRAARGVLPSPETQAIYRSLMNM
jgi:two-component SAPR family response regulator